MHPLLTHWLKILGATAGVIVGFVALVVVALWLLMPDLCGNSVIAESVAPGGRIRAVVFNRDCGATTGFSTQVSILRSSESLPNNGGNIFVADCDHGRAPAGPSGGPDIKVTWVSDSHLRIEHHPLIRLFKAEPVRRDIKIEYSPVQSDSQSSINRSGS
jgi:hypothetical protein